MTYCAWQDMSCENETYSEEPDLICHEDYVFMIFRWSATFGILNSWKKLFVRLIFQLLFIKFQIPGCTEEIIK